MFPKRGQIIMERSIHPNNILQYMHLRHNPQCFSFRLPCIAFSFLFLAFPCLFFFFSLLFPFFFFFPSSFQPLVLRTAIFGFNTPCETCDTQQLISQYKSRMCMLSNRRICASNILHQLSPDLLLPSPSLHTCTWLFVSPFFLLPSNGRVNPCDKSSTFNFLFQRHFAALAAFS